MENLTELQKCEQQLASLVRERDNTKDYWWKNELLKKINKLLKLRTKLRAGEKGEYFTTNKLYKDLYEIAKLEKLQTRTSAIRGYRPVTGGQIEITSCNDDYDIYFYKKNEKIPEVINALQDRGYVIKYHSESCITVCNYIKK